MRNTKLKPNSISNLLFLREIAISKQSNSNVEKIVGGAQAVGVRLHKSVSESDSSGFYEKVGIKNSC